MSRLKNLVRDAIRRTGFDVVRWRPERAAATVPADFEPEIAAIVRRVRPFTMTSPERVHALCKATEYVVAHRIPGAFVECGVWRGGSMIAVAETLLRAGVRDRDLYLFDTYEGMTEPGAADVGIDGVEARALYGTTEAWCAAGLEEVQANLDATGYPRERVHLVKGMVEDTIPGAAPDAIALLRLDTDWYESTRHELEHLYPRLAAGGVLIIDDYGYWRGSRKAVDEYLAAHDARILLTRLDHSGRLAVKG